jgi:septal ring factor EnvC (AmiA/AmiB activator)
MKNKNYLLKYQVLMLRRNKYILVFFTLLLSFSAFSQTKEELKKQKLSIEKEINYTAKLLKKTKTNKDKSLSYLKVLDKQIQNQEYLLQTLHIEISLLNKQIRKTEQAIIKTEQSVKTEQENLELLKSEYAKMIYACFKKKGNRNDLMFIISAEDFNQAYKRTVYLKQYISFRKNQAEKITESKKELESKKGDLNTQKDQLTLEVASKKELISAKKNELTTISDTKQEKQELINRLGKSEKLFKKQLQDKQKRAKALDDKIRKIIAEEIRKAREEAEKKNKGFALTPEAMALSSEFNSNKGKLPWPLEKGIIVQGYGKQKHAVFSGIETFNNGIDIATDKKAIVRAVFDGTISRIFFIKGEGKAILMNHGEYFSVYSGLTEVSVKVGEKLLAKEKIGIVFTQEVEEKSELHFEIWKGYDKHDPSKWLYEAY